MLVRRENAGGLSVVAVKHFEDPIESVPIAELAGELTPDRGRLQSHGVVYAVSSEIGVLLFDLIVEAELRKLRFPIMTLRVELAGEFEEPRIPVAVVEPEQRQHFVLPAIDGPLFQRALIESLGLVSEIFLHHRDDARIARGLLILSHGLEHHVIGPPVVGLASILLIRGPNPAVRLLVIERPAHPLFHVPPALPTPINTLPPSH